MFFIVGPTAAGKSDIAAEVARQCGAEVVSADAFQLYRGFDLLSGKPDASTLRKAPHHLISAFDSASDMNAERFRRAALAAIGDIQARGANPIVVGGSGMYLKALTHGLSALPSADPHVRAQLQGQPLATLFERLQQLDPETAEAIDRQNKHRVQRALEICLLTHRPASEQRQRAAPAEEPRGVFIFRDRADMYQRINARVERMFADGVVEEVKRAQRVGATAAKMLGLREIQQLIAGEISESECIAAIQQATRRYAKRQLTWFRHQSNFEPLNLSLHGSAEAIELIARKARLSFARS